MKRANSRFSSDIDGRLLRAEKDIMLLMISDDPVHVW